MQVEPRYPRRSRSRQSSQSVLSPPFYPLGRYPQPWPCTYWGRYIALVILTTGFIPRYPWSNGIPGMCCVSYWSIAIWVWLWKSCSPKPSKTQWLIIIFPWEDAQTCTHLHFQTDPRNILDMYLDSCPVTIVSHHNSNPPLVPYQYSIHMPFISHSYPLYPIFMLWKNQHNLLNTYGLLMVPVPLIPLISC